MERDDFQQRFITPEAQRSLNRFSSGGRAFGEKKTFANGKTGVWDGTGWVAQNP
jgi:hypothetical protein